MAQHTLPPGTNRPTVQQAGPTIRLTLPTALMTALPTRFTVLTTLRTNLPTPRTIPRNHPPRRLRRRRLPQALAGSGRMSRSRRRVRVTARANHCSDFILHDHNTTPSKSRERERKRQERRTNQSQTGLGRAVKREIKNFSFDQDTMRRPEINKYYKDGSAEIKCSNQFRVGSRGKRSYITSLTLALVKYCQRSYTDFKTEKDKRGEMGGAETSSKQ